MSRPKYPKADGNNRVVIDALETLGPVECDASRLRYTLKLPYQTIVALKIADMPGQTDWLLLSSRGWYQAVEVKEPGKERDFTDGELSWMETIGLRVVCNKEQVLECLK